MIKHEWLYSFALAPALALLALAAALSALTLPVFLLLFFRLLFRFLLLLFFLLVLAPLYLYISGGFKSRILVGKTMTTS